MQIEYKLKDFKPYEIFRVSLNGKTIATDNMDSPDDEPKVIDHKMEKKGYYTLDITVLSDYQDKLPAPKSSARALVNMITVFGSDMGGAQECLPCPAGFINTGKNSHCERCPPGYQASADQSKCELCPGEQFKPTTEGQCQECPEYTTPDPFKTQC